MENYLKHDEQEIWKDIPGYEGHYQASNFGRIKSLQRKVRFTGRWNKELLRLIPEKILKHENKINGAGYYGVVLGRGKSEMVHRLVCLAFNGLPTKTKFQVNHKDCNKLNNHAKNLEWISHKKNMRHAVKNGRFIEHNKKCSERWSGAKNVKAKLNEQQIIEIRNSKGIIQTELAKKYGVSQSMISAILIRKSWKSL